MDTYKAKAHRQENEAVYEIRAYGLKAHRQGERSIVKNNIDGVLIMHYVQNALGRKYAVKLLIDAK